MVCDQCNEHNVTLALLCKTLLPEHLNNNLKPYLKCERCKFYHHKRFITLNRNYFIHNIIWDYDIKDIKLHLKTTKTKQQLNKISLDYIKYMFHCISFYKGGRFYDNWMKNDQRRYEQRIRNTMKVKYEINLKTFLVAFYKEICDKRMKREDALFMEKYIRRLLSLV